MKSLNQKILAGFGVVLLLLLIVLGITFTKVNHFKNQTDKMVTKDVKLLSALDDLTFNTVEKAALTRAFLLSGDPDFKKRFAGVVAGNKVIQDEVTKEIGTAQFQKMMDNSSEWEKLIEQQVFQTYDKGEKDTAINILNKEGQALIQPVIDGLNQLKTNKKNEINALGQDLSNSGTSLLIIIIVCSIVALIVGFITAFYLARQIVNPIIQIMQRLKLIAEGDLSGESMEIRSKDEVGMLASALGQMTDNLNEVMGNIQAASEQVASGSKQVSESSMSLSQGATEQASSVEQLTASLEEISSQTKLNADNAAQANVLAEEAKANAAQGNEQMKGMLSAMDDINDASGNISKIIKVIDEIAFQTNILALNAAVEAARAGQHGKGFAVVAEEVRNLAARSANAAKETTELIEGSIKKVEGGTKIANETAVALGRIVDGVTKVANLVSDIAEASNEQAIGVAQINQGINQVSQVVQTNSATSEESAAASEELSSQAEMMKEQVGRFKLRKVGRSSSYAELDELSPDVIRMLESMSNKKWANKDAYAEVAAAGSSPRKIALSDREFGKY
jgi:methyl-accepting chemotaxis protein